VVGLAYRAYTRGDRRRDDRLYTGGDCRRDRRRGQSPPVYTIQAIVAATNTCLIEQPALAIVAATIACSVGYTRGVVAATIASLRPVAATIAPCFAVYTPYYELLLFPIVSSDKQ